LAIHRDRRASRGPVRRAKGRVRLIGFGEANVVIGHAPGTRVSGLAGSSVIQQVFLGADDPAGLIAKIHAHRQND